jgi:hypothetical protein
MDLNELDTRRTNRPFGLEFVFIMCIFFALRGVIYLLKNFAFFEVPTTTAQQEVAQHILATKQMMFGAFSVLCVLGIALKKPIVRVFVVLLPVFKYTCTYFVYKFIDAEGLGFGLFVAVLLVFYLYGMRSVKDYFSGNTNVRAASAV